MKTNYWKNLCLLLIGSIIGCTYHKYSHYVEPKPITIEVKDTIIIRDTVTKITSLSRHSVYEEIKRQNIPHANIVLAQSLLETGEYKSSLTRTHKNIFGMRNRNGYKKYTSYEECIGDYKKRISSRYKGGDYYKFIRDIGYAEDPEYITKLKKIS